MIYFEMSKKYNIFVVKIKNKFMNYKIEFLKSYNKDYLYLSKNATFNKIVELLEINKIIICNLHDKNGKIGLSIIEVQNDFVEDDCKIIMKHDEIYKLQDKFLYNLIYNINSDEFSLEEQDEYFEKITIENNEN